VYATHQRSEGDGIDPSLDEVFRIAREASIPAHIFHLKTMYRQNFGRMPAVIQRIEAARRDGLDITADVYPYVAASSSLDALLPLWARDGGREKMLARLQDPHQRARIKEDLKISPLEWENEYYGAGGAQGFLITDVTNPALKPLVGRRLSDIARDQNKDPVDVIMDLILEDAVPPMFVSFIMNEPDVQLALRQPWAAFCTDSSIQAMDGPLFEGSPHPRAYGAFTRVLGHYVRDERVLALPDAIRKATSLPAQFLGIRDRGLVREGFYADLVIFDPDTVADNATFEKPHQYSAGISYVLVNGEVVVDHNRISAARPGMVLRGPGFSAKH
jgi:dihydroorotase/N-acyl-D-amino-acid deacylase